MYEQHCRQTQREKPWYPLWNVQFLITKSVNLHFYICSRYIYVTGTARNEFSGLRTATSELGGKFSDFIKCWELLRLSEELLSFPWMTALIRFKTSVNISVILVGPSCTILNSTDASDIYYKLLLAIRVTHAYYEQGVSFISFWNRSTKLKLIFLIT
jgi:hypothetical protein